MPLERRDSERFVPYTENDVSSDDEATNLPSQAPKLSDKEFDPVTFNVSKVAPEDFASQLTLLDLPVFAAIRPEELTSCAWHTKEKLTLAPNVVAMTRRFNQTCLWCQKEILNCQRVKTRAEVLAHFIKIAKKLLALRNLHSAFAVISGLQSSPIYRLAKTWEAVSAKDHTTFDKLARLFQDDDNWRRLRKFMEGIKLPCVPYLGLYLTDLNYVDVAHPTSGGLESTQRQTKMNNILRVIAEYQRSTYDGLHRIECVQEYFKSVRYIDELQKFVEDDLYKLSLALEPPQQQQSNNDSISSCGGASGSSRRGSQLVCKTDSLPPLPSTVMSRLVSQKTQSLTPQAPKARLIGHRKTQSLSSNIPFRYANESFTSNEPTPGLVECHRHLLDDSLLDFSSCTISSASSHLPIHEQVLEDSGNDSERESVKRCDTAPLTGSLLQPKSPAIVDKVVMEGPVSKKTLLREGRRPTMASWNRAWLVLSGSTLYIHSMRPLPSWTLPSRNSEQRTSYKNRPTKCVSISGWMVLTADNPYSPDSFILQDTIRGNVYKFRVSSQGRASEWFDHLKAATERDKDKLPTNLMSFD